jgi:pilus assembly protein CpaB
MTPLVRNLLMAVGAVALLTGVSIGVVWLRNGAGASSIAQSQGEKPATSILVAGRTIEPGTLLRAEDFAWRDIGAAGPPAGALVKGRDSDAELVGALARKGFAQGELIAVTGVLKPTERGFLAATLRPGYRAVTIPIEAQQSASGLVLPGDRVDVILVQQFATRSGGRDSSGETILRDARVVAAGHVMETAQKTPAATAGSQEPAPPRTLTLEALPNDAQRLFVAAQLGKLEVALRPVAEPNIVAAEARPVFSGDVSSALQPAVSTTITSATTSSHKRSVHIRKAASLPPVEVLRGSKSTQ